jgi:hypothetical protein
VLRDASSGRGSYETPWGQHLPLRLLGTRALASTGTIAWGYIPERDMSALGPAGMASFVTLAALAVATSLVAAGTPAPSPTRCAPPAPSGSSLKTAPPLVVQTRGAGCSTARRIVRVYLATCRDEFLYEAPCVVLAGRRAWRCVNLVLGPWGDYSRISCTSGSTRAVSFYSRFHYG